jgi:hypothetical protein
MWKIYKFQLLIMSPFLVLSLIIVVPIYLLYKFVPKLIALGNFKYVALQRT